MSKIIESKLQLKCSLEVLRRALIRVMPQWEAHILVDPEGRIPVYGYEGKNRGYTCNLVIPGGRHPGYSVPPGRDLDNDWGFKLDEDGKWTIIKADYGNSSATILEKNITAEVGNMKAKAVAKIRGYNILQDTFDDGVSILRLSADKDQIKSLLQA